jgi:hypothetical protein
MNYAVEGLTPTAEPEGGYLIPDAPSKALAAADDEHDRFSIKLGLAMLLDYSWFDQDAASVAQVGTQNDGGEVRDARITTRGELGFLGGWRYQVTAQYKGFDREPTETDDWNFTDVNLSHDFAFGTLTFGKLKQTYSYEMVGDAANLPQSERLLTPFKSRDIGARLTKTFRAQRGTYNGTARRSSSRGSGASTSTTLSRAAARSRSGTSARTGGPPNGGRRRSATATRISTA